MADALLTATGLVRRFGSGESAVTAVDGIDVAVRPGELLAIRGRSGSGKTTLLNLLGGLDRPTEGRIEFDGTDIATASEARLVALRRTRFAFVFQGFGLVPELTAAENVEVPLRLRRTDPAERDERVAAALDAVGLARAAKQRTTELSGGQRQRVGIARALVGAPDLLFADEPTGQLDSATGAAILDLLLERTRAAGAAAIVSTHDDAVLERADRVLELRDGRVV